MANFRITPTSSVRTTGNNVHAFTGDTPGADALVVDANAYLQAEGIGARGAVLGNTKAWKVDVNGSIVSKQSDAIFLAAGNTADVDRHRRRQRSCAGRQPRRLRHPRPERREDHQCRYDRWVQGRHRAAVAPRRTASRIPD